jgi:hypothetical protein
LFALPILRESNVSVSMLLAALRPERGSRTTSCTALTTIIGVTVPRFEASADR